MLEGAHAHVITVNDYLVKRDATWTMPAFEKLGLSVGYLQANIEPWGEGAKLRRAWTLVDDAIEPIRAANDDDALEAA